MKRSLINLCLSNNNTWPNILICVDKTSLGVCVGDHLGTILIDDHRPMDDPPAYGQLFRLAWSTLGLDSSHGRDWSSTF